MALLSTTTRTPPPPLWTVWRPQHQLHNTQPCAGVTGTCLSELDSFQGYWENYLSTVKLTNVSLHGTNSAEVTAVGAHRHSILSLLALAPNPAAAGTICTGRCSSKSWRDRNSSLTGRKGNAEAQVSRRWLNPKSF